MMRVVWEIKPNAHGIFDSNGQYEAFTDPCPICKNHGAGSGATIADAKAAANRDLHDKGSSAPCGGCLVLARL
jgi:hypothetical protein